MHANETAFEANVTLPTELNRRFYRDSRPGGAENRLFVGGVLTLEKQPARQGDDRRRNALFLENVQRLDRETQFRAGA